MSNFSYYRNFGEFLSEQRVPYFYCTKCKRHYFDGKDYTAEEWFFYVNEETYQDYRKRIQNQENADLMQSIHAHEVINHSNPREN